MTSGYNYFMQTLIPILIYFAFLFAVGFSMRKVASKGSKEFFLAGRDLPWWLAGTSIVATTFAADTPLVITGIIANKGLSGNWFWFSAIFAHALVVVVFAKNWSRAGTVTDSELISMRYSGKAVKHLRLFRAFLAGVVINCITMGWVIRAMAKICSQFIDWQTIAPGFYRFIDSLWPKVGVLGNTSDAITIIGLIAIVVAYSSMGGLKAVILTDFIQFAIAVLATGFLSYEIWQAVGGQAGLNEKLTGFYGANHDYTNLFPSSETSWLKKLNMGLGVFMVYLFAQSCAQPEADGSGFLMQRINSTKSDKDAAKASLLFVILHYLVRIWPWIVVGVGALVLIPIGNEGVIFGESALAVGEDRELAFPFLMKQYLSPLMLGLLLTSFLAAFMSTMDTHINWGASYVVNDWLPLFKSDLSQRQKTMLSRLSVVGFGLLAILVSFQINSIEKAWQWVAAVAASIGVPNILRWLWWRVSAVGEISAMIVGFLSAVLLINLEVAYEFRLIVVILCSFIGLLIGIFFGPTTDKEIIDSFYDKVQPFGIWPERQFFPTQEIIKVIAIISGVIFGLWFIKSIIFGF